ncbi:MAG: transglycosylase SLT domain-containing protein [Phreatobacter sp.]
MADGFVFGGNTGETAGSIAKRRARAELMRREGMSTQPVGHWLQGLARVAQGLMGALEEHDVDRAEQAAAARAQLASAHVPAAQPVSAAAPGPVNPLTAGSANDYMANLTAQESGNDPNARNPNSSATGLAQFTTRTWNDLARRQPRLGLTPDGRTDPDQARRAAVAFTQENQAILGRGGIPTTPGNLYMTHFLGQAGGPRFLTGLAANPDGPATGLVSPGAARANRGVFFNAGGAPRSAQEVYDLQTRRFRGAAPGPDGTAPGTIAGVPTAGPPRPASAGPGQPPVPAAGTPLAQPVVLNRGMPLPEPRPAYLGMPLPQPRPANLAMPEPQPRPAMAPRPDIAAALGLSEADRLALLRDEVSLTPDEIERLRGGLVSSGSRTSVLPFQALTSLVDRLRSPPSR